MTNIPDPRPLRVLVVEDDDYALDMYVVALESAGMESRGASDVNVAFAAAVDWRPDVIVTDFLLGGGPDGARLCARVHEDPRTKHIPTLVLTGSTRKADAEAILGAGCADIRLKPYLPEALLADVRRLAASPSAERRRSA